MTAAGPAAREDTGAPQQGTFRTAATMVAVQVTVLHGSALVPGLQAKDFTILEDGVPQEVQFFDSREVPMDVTVLLDSSSSMRGRMSLVQDSAAELIATLRPQDRAAVAAFAGSFTMLQTLTVDREAIVRAIRSATPGGDTTLRNALYVALRGMNGPAPEAGTMRREAVVVLSDGDDTASMVSFDDLLELAQNTGVTLYPVLLRPESRVQAFVRRNPKAAEFEMRQLAKNTGGEALFLDRIEQLNAASTKIAAELAATYSLAYVPINTRADGTFRRIDVRVLSNPEFQTKARAGYTAARQRR
jgi:VWFA-related protein